MVPMHRWMVLPIGALLGVSACGTRETSEAPDGAGARSPAVVAASAPLPGFSADVPAGLVPGTVLPPAAPPAGGTPSGSSTTSGAAPAGTTTAASTPPGGSASTPSGTPPGGSRAGSAPSGSASPAASTSSASTPAATPATTPTGAAALAPGEISAATGVFTAAQAERGRAVYTNSCARCHMVSAHSGGAFASTWNTRRVSDLYELIYNTMPLDSPGSLTAQEYVDVVAYMLQLNGHPAGKSALVPDPAALRKVRIDIRSSTAP